MDNSTNSVNYHKSLNNWTVCYVVGLSSLRDSEPTTPSAADNSPYATWERFIPLVKTCTIVSAKLDHLKSGQKDIIKRIDGLNRKIYRLIYYFARAVILTLERAGCGKLQDLITAKPFHSVLTPVHSEYDRIALAHELVQLSPEFPMI
ncbi:hypothetical protein C7212DRAFT_364783 [Tuber magnatum]|uniref:Uncharacterized protein n=1 Tax=Tuber magnatum TaxID=42249 RepID=A0A317SNN5_9PEZI|nr:hypothetical protein C7212DRAFT_364783 [Tuber magnatum]